MKKALIVAYYFPPIAASGSLRPLGFCRYLEQYGWSPRVLTTEPRSVYPPLQIDETLNQGLPLSLQVDRIPSANPLHTLITVRDKLRSELKRLFSSKSKQPIEGNEFSKKDTISESDGRLTAYKDLILDWIFSFPDPQCFWLRPAIRRMSEMSVNKRPDVVFATGSPWTGLLVGRALAQKFHVPFVADFRDPWMGGNPYKRQMAASLQRRARKFEKAVCAAAVRVVANTEELREQFVAEYPEFKKKFVTIANGFDSDGVTPSKEGALSNHLTLSPAAGGQLEFCHFGTVYGERNPFCFLQAIKELYAEHRLAPERLRVRCVGSWQVSDEHCEVIARELEQKGILRRDPPVPREVCLQQMARAQTLLVFQPASPLQIPAKIYEYIATGRPLLVIGGEGATAHLVEQHQLGHCCANRVADIKTLLLRLATGQTQIDPPQPSVTARFDYRMLTGELAKVFDAAYAVKR